MASVVKTSNATLLICYLYSMQVSMRAQAQRSKESSGSGRRNDLSMDIYGYVKARMPRNAINIETNQNVNNTSDQAVALL